MKFLYIILFFCHAIYLNAQVLFDLDINLEKINLDDEICELSVNDQNEEIHVIYRNESFNDSIFFWSYVKYDYQGFFNHLYSKSYTDDEYFLSAKTFEIEENQYLLECYRTETEHNSWNDPYYNYLHLKIYDCETYAFVDSISFEIGYVNEWNGTYITEVNTIRIIVIDNLLTFHIGYSTHHFMDDGFDYSSSNSTQLVKFSFDNFINLIEVIPSSGYELFYFPDSQHIVSTAYSSSSYSAGMGQAGGSSNSYKLKLLSCENPSFQNTILTISGSSSWDYMGGGSYCHYPSNCIYLSRNDESYNDNEMVIYNKEIDSSSGTQYLFRSYSPTGNLLWVRNDSSIGYQPIVASTCVSVDYEDHYVMYFRGHLLEIRDRIGGDILFNQYSTFIPFEIVSDLYGNLIFCEETLSGIKIYRISEEIQTSSSDNEIPQSNIQLSNFPNPFNPLTEIRFQISEYRNVESAKLEIFNIKGERIREYAIFNNQSSIVWDGTDQNNKPVSSGVYLYKLKAGDFEDSKKMLLLK